MEEEPGLSDQYRKASPWPMFVALGFALSEVGIIIGIFPIAVGGLLLFGGSVAGILKESAYVDTLWGSLFAFGGALAAIGVGVVAWLVGIDPGVLIDVIAAPGEFGLVVPRALAVAIAGIILLAAGGTVQALERNADLR
ncbi:MAG: cox cluster protein [Halorientalis sp.]